MTRIWIQLDEDWSLWDCLTRIFGGYLRGLKWVLFQLEVDARLCVCICGIIYGEGSRLIFFSV